MLVVLVPAADRLVRTMMNMAGLPLIDAVRMITTTAARIMKISDRKGSLVTGKDADILIFDENVHIQMTMVKGRVIYER